MFETQATGNNSGFEARYDRTKDWRVKANYSRIKTRQPVRLKSDMRQLDRTERKEPINQMLVRCINVGLAAKTLNDVLEHRDVPAQRERVALAIFNKLVPSMAAVAIEHRADGPSTVHDLNAMLLSSGLQPLDTTAEIPIEGESVLDPGTPPDSDT